MSAFEQHRPWQIEERVHRRCADPCVTGLVKKKKVSCFTGLVQGFRPFLLSEPRTQVLLSSLHTARSGHSPSLPAPLSAPLGFCSPMIHASGCTLIKEMALIPSSPSCPLHPPPCSLSRPGVWLAVYQPWSSCRTGEGCWWSGCCCSCSTSCWGPGTPAPAPGRPTPPTRPPTRVQRCE